MVFVLFLYQVFFYCVTLASLLPCVLWSFSFFIVSLFTLWFNFTPSGKSSGSILANDYQVQFLVQDEIFCATKLKKKLCNKVRKIQMGYPQPIKFLKLLLLSDFDEILYETFQFELLLKIWTKSYYFHKLVPPHSKI